MSPQRHHNLTVRVERFASAAVVRVRGEVDLSTVARLERAVGDAFAVGAKHLVIDLTRCAFLGGVGLTVLVNATRRGVLAGTSVAVAADPATSPHRVITVTGLARHLTLIEYSAAAHLLAPA